MCYKAGEFSASPERRSADLLDMVFCITTGIAAEKSYAIENDRQQLFRRSLSVAGAHKARAQLRPPEQIALAVRHTDQPVHPGQDVCPSSALIASYTVSRLYWARIHHSMDMFSEPAGGNDRVRSR